MAFEKTVETITYAELDQQTKYRFAEIEMGKALHPLTQLHLNATTPRQAAQNLLLDLIGASRDYPRKESAFNDMLSAHSTTTPRKEELINYLLVRGHSYAKIRELTSASFNTISKFKFHVPFYVPTYAYWTEEQLIKWDHVKKNLNLFNETLVHMKK